MKSDDGGRRTRTLTQAPAPCLVPDRRFTRTGKRNYKHCVPLPPTLPFQPATAFCDRFQKIGVVFRRLFDHVRGLVKDNVVESYTRLR